MKSIITQAYYHGEPINGVYNPTREQLLASGFRDVPEVPPVADGYVRLSRMFVEDDGVKGKWVCVDRLKSEVDGEQQAADLAANATRYALQNQYLSLCDQLTGVTTHTKLGFAELQAIIAAMMDSVPNQAVALSLQLLTLNAALVREGGVNWWDNCEWRELPK